MRKKIKIGYYSSPCGELILGDCEEELCLCDWLAAEHRLCVDNRVQRLLKMEYVEGNTELIDRVRNELDEYFAGDRRGFDIPLRFVGTDFQIMVWRRLQEIGYGETLTYGELAKRLGMPTAVRSVANTIGKNALPIIVPCHRVVGINHSMVGYSGGMEAKIFLLNMEVNCAGYGVEKV